MKLCVLLCTMCIPSISQDCNEEEMSARKGEIKGYCGMISLLPGMKKQFQKLECAGRLGSRAKAFLYLIH